MARGKPTTIYLEDRLARAVRLKAALDGKRMSAIVSEALSAYLAEDARDLQIIREREKEPARDYEDVLAEMKRDGLL